MVSHNQTLSQPSIARPEVIVTAPATQPAPLPLGAPLPRSAQQTLTALLDAQLWYWGQDILHPEGNALMAYGFGRVRGPDDRTQRSTAYELPGDGVMRRDLHGLHQMIAWGFGVLASHAELVRLHGSLVLVRHEAAPGLCATPVTVRAGTRALLPARTMPACPGAWICLCASIVAVARCCADYEAWSRPQLGTAHRRDAQQRRPRVVRRRNPQPPFLDDAWRRLADRIERDALSASGRPS